ncbi:hypothetical protein [Aestuariispira insulae]|uniref:Uncharacterized protein n=1 Tax=Aestuariispira insulae TaxID=1461337 RepID=A0A3D9HRT9_9PROT|nr:hypothetical protein [Aestuariispira insulae]RED52180.1 hypothetical protein DFP90_102198 [Aestuariispira insulae]
MNEDDIQPVPGIEGGEENAVQPLGGVFDSSVEIDAAPENRDGGEDYTLPEGMDDTAGAPFLELAQDLGLSGEQFERLLSVRDKRLAGHDEAMRAETDNQIAEATVALREKWGRNFAANGRLAERALSHFAGPELMADLQAGGWTRAPAFIEFLHAVGARLGEDDLTRPAGGPGGNPWRTDNPNLTEQGRLMRENPALARSLAAQAGISLG